MRYITVLSLMILLASLQTAQASYWDKFMNLFKDTAEKIATPTLNIEQYKGAFEQETKTVERTLFTELPISFEFHAPKDWESFPYSTDILIDRRLLKDIDFYQGPVIVGGTRPSLQLQAIELEHEILAEHWLQNYIFQNGFTQTKPIKSMSETDAEAEFIFLDGGIAQQAYMKAYIVGKRLLTLRFNVPEIAEDKLKAFGPLTIDSFTITGFTSDIIEETTDFSFQNQLNFAYPNSWEVKNTSMTNPYEKSLELQNLKDGNIKGLIRMLTYRKKGDYTVPNIISKFQSVIKDTHGIRIVDLNGTMPLNIGISYDTAITEMYEAGLSNTQLNNYEFWVTALESENWVNFIYLITPNQDIDFYNWARNTRAYDLIVHSIN